MASTSRVVPLSLKSGAVKKSAKRVSAPGNASPFTEKK